MIPNYLPTSTQFITNYNFSSSTHAQSIKHEWNYKIPNQISQIHILGMVAKWQIIILNYWSSSLIRFTKILAITYLHANWPHIYSVHGCVFHAGTHWYSLNTTNNSIVYKQNFHEILQILHHKSIKHTYIHTYISLQVVQNYFQNNIPMQTKGGRTCSTSSHQNPNIKIINH